MRRPTVAAVVAAVAAVTVLIVVAIAGAALLDDDGPVAHPMSGVMIGQSADGSWHGPGGGMHGRTVADEFDYLVEMVAHHEEAVQAAGELSRSARPELRAFGRVIVTSQSAQIDRMNGWLEEWYPGRSTDADYEPMMRDLTGLEGNDLDETFLRDMIVHHMMAVMMSQQALRGGVFEHQEVAELARDIRDEQRSEIFRMRRWLMDWYDEDP